MDKHIARWWWGEVEGYVGWEERVRVGGWSLRSWHKPGPVNMPPKVSMSPQEAPSSGLGEAGQADDEAVSVAAVSDASLSDAAQSSGSDGSQNALLRFQVIEEAFARPCPENLDKDGGAHKEADALAKR